MEIKNPLRRFENEKIQYLIIAGLLFLIMTTFLAGLYISSDYFLEEIRVRLVEFLEEELVTEVKIDNISLDGFNRVVAEDILVKDNSARDMIQAEEIVVDYSFLSFIVNGFYPLAGIEEIDINQPYLDLIEEDGRYNIEFIIENIDLAEVEVPIMHLLTGDIYFNHGQIDLKNEIISDSLKNIEVEINTGEVINYSAKAELASQKKAELLIDANSIIQDYELELSVNNLDLNQLRDNLELDFFDGIDLAGDFSASSVIEGRIGDDFQTANDLEIKDGFVEYLDYQFEDIEAELKADKYGLEIESLKASFLEAPLTISGDIFDWSQPEFYLDYQIKELALSKAKKDLLKAADISTENQVEIKALADLSGQVMGDLKDLDASLALEIGPGELEQIPFNSLKGQAYYNDGLINLADLEVEIYEGAITGSGDIILEDELVYLIDLNAADLEVDRLANDLLQQQELDLEGIDWLEDDTLISGVLASDIIISGERLALDKLNLIGDVSLTDGKVNGYYYDSFSSEFWLDNEDVLLNNTELKTDKSNYAIEGVIGLDGSLNLIWQAENVYLKELDGFHQQEDLRGIINADGILNGRLNQPQIDGDFELSEFKYDTYSLSKLEGRFNLFQDRLNLNSVVIPEINSNLTAEIDLANGDSVLDLMVNRTDINNFFEVLDVDFKATGEIYGEAKLESFLTDPKAKGEFLLEEGDIDTQSFDIISLDAEYMEQELVINDLSASYNASYFNANGVYQDELAIDVYSKEFYLEDIDHEFVTERVELAGRAELEGRVYGALNNLEAVAKTEGRELKVNGYDIANLTGKANFRGENLYINDAIIDLENNDYHLNGSLDLSQREINNLVLKANQGSIKDINQFVDDDLALDTEHEFSGIVRAKGPILNPRGDLDIIVYKPNSSGYLNLEGDYYLGDAMDFELEVNNFDISPFNDLDLLPFDITGKLDLAGSLTGNLEEIDFDSNLRMSDGQVDEITYQELEGRLRVLESSKLSVDQNLVVGESNSVSVYGQIPIEEKKEFDLNVDLTEGNLSILPAWVEEISEARGRSRGSVKVTGTLANPHLAGEAEIVTASFKHELLARKIEDLNASINFSGNEIELEYLTGDYGAGNLEIQGGVLLDRLVPDELDFEIEANNIAFEHGSWEGKNTGDIAISGDFFSPLISGEITALNTFFSLPFEWPTTASEGEAFIQPEFDLTIKPGEDVRVGNRNIDILVESGALNLRGSGEDIDLVGSLSSRTGQFLYYNTLFELEEASANFRRNDFIPILSINAFTDLDNERVDLNLSGPADQMEFDVVSEDGVEREEVIDRLAQQGGLGSLLDRSYDDIVQDEMMRLINESLRLEVFSRVERSFEETLDLDEFRIRSILNNQIEVEVGKFIIADLMLKYEHKFGIEEIQSVGFEYYFDGTRQDLTIGGYYDSYGNYEFRLDTRIPF